MKRLIVLIVLMATGALSIVVAATARPLWDPVAARRSPDPIP